MSLTLVPESTGEPEELDYPRPAQVIRMEGVTKLDLEPDDVLKNAIGKLKTVVVIGFDEDGEEWFASSMADGADVLWHLERCKLMLLRVADKESSR